MLSKVFLLFLTLLMASPFEHAIYLSVIEIVREEEDSSVEVRLKVFSDDLQDVLRSYASKTNQEVNLNVEDSNNLLDSYFRDNLKITINKKSLRLTLESTSIENDATFLVFTGLYRQIWKDMEVDAPYFLELFPTQVNTIIIINGDKKYYGRTKKNVPSYRITLN